MSILTILTVGYNEEINLPKLFQSIAAVEDILTVRKIYVDQTSTDSSVDIATRSGAEVHIHPNKGYADPDKKWAVEALCHDDEWIMILDADEGISGELAQEIKTIMATNHEVGNIKIRSIIFGGFGGEAYQPRLFKKKGVHLTLEIHKYIEIRSPHVAYLKNYIRNEDLKHKGKEVSLFIEKLNRYSDKELDLLPGLSKLSIVWNMRWKPLLRFFGFGIRHKQFLRGTQGLMLCVLMAYYQWSIYAKLYEKYYLHHHD